MTNSILQFSTARKLDKKCDEQWRRGIPSQSSVQSFLAHFIWCTYITCHSTYLHMLSIEEVVKQGWLLMYLIHIFPYTFYRAGLLCRWLFIETVTALIHSVVMMMMMVMRLGLAFLEKLSGWNSRWSNLDIMIKSLVEIWKQWLNFLQSLEWQKKVQRNYSAWQYHGFFQSLQIRLNIQCLKY